MAQTLNIEQKLTDLLDTRDFHPEILDKDGRPTSADEAKTFSFDYISSTGKNYGTMVIVLGDENEMMIMYGDNLGKTMESPEDRQEFFDFQAQLTDLANRNRWTSTLTDIGKLKRVQAGIAAIKEGLFEGYYGNRKVSYAGEPTEARLMIKHNRTLGENDARFRYVESLFIETADSERFKLPFTNLAGGRAMLEHVRQGGKPYDIRGSHICEVISELKVLNRFNRASASRVMEGVTQEIVEQAHTYYKSLRESLKRLGTARGYSAYFESWHPAEIGEQEGLVEDIKTMFIEQTLDTRIEDALPLLAKIQQQGRDMKEADIFESWINNLAEGTWSLPETPEQLNQLKELMSQELIVGPDATNATEQLYSLVGDDILFDRLADLAERDPRANAWNDTDVMERLRELGIETPEQAPAGAEDPNAVAVAPAPIAPAPVAPVAEELNAMRRAAGLAESILDESGETLDHILNRFKFEVKQFEQSGDLDHDLYEALFDYYSDHGEMPYSVAKGRDADPFNWVSDKLSQHMGIGESVLDEFGIDTLNQLASHPMAGPLAAAGGAALGGVIGKGIEKAGDWYKNRKERQAQDKQHAVDEGSCNATMEGEYCPEHGLAECGGMYEMGTVAGSVAPVMDEGNDDAINYNGAITGSYYESKEGDALLDRIKSLALLK